MTQDPAPAPAPAPAPGKLPKPPKHPMLARCSYCEHRWVLLHLPMEIHAAARVIKGAHCPNCGRGSEYIYVGGSDHP